MRVTLRVALATISAWGLIWCIARAQSFPAAPPLSDPPESVDQIRAKAEAGDAQAQYQLARDYNSGTNVPKGYKQAFDWCLKSAEQGYVKAEFTVATLYQDGIGVAKDEPTSFHWYQRAADHGCAPAELVVARHYYGGIDVAKDNAQAFKWIRKAADQDDSKAERAVAYFYLYGDPSLRDWKKGFTYALRAAGRDNIATSYVAECYRRGLFVKPDLVQAYAYALYSDTLGHTEENSSQLVSYVSEMTPDQIDQATQALTRLQNRFANHQQLSFSLNGHASANIPFRSVDGHLIVSVQLGKLPPADFIFDTGSSYSFLDDRYAVQLGSESNDYSAVLGLGVEPVLAKISEPMSLSLGSATWEKVPFRINPLSVDREIGQPIAGVIGSDVLQQSVLHIDYEHHIIEVIDPNFFHPAPGMSEPLSLEVRFNLPYLRASLTNEGIESKKESFLLDTGIDTSVDLEPGFWADNSDFPFTPTGHGGVTGPGGAAVFFGTGICSAISLGAIQLEHVVVNARSFPGSRVLDPNGGGIGNAILRRFDLTIDFPGKRLYLQKNSRFGDPWTDVNFGMHIVTDGPDYNTFTVTEILPGSAGSRAGFQSGDVILRVNDMDHLTIEKIREAFATAGTYHVLVQRQGQPLTLDLHCTDDLK